MPSMTGMFTSSSTRSNAVARARSSASSPSAAAVTSKPALLERDAHHVAHRRPNRPQRECASCRGSRQRGRQSSFDAEQARSLADDRRIAQPLDLALRARRGRARRRTAAASWRCRCARRCRRRAYTVAASRGADTASASARLRLSRCSWRRARVSAARAPQVLQPRQPQRRAPLCACASPSWYSSGSFGTDFTDSFAVSAFARSCFSEWGHSSCCSPRRDRAARSRSEEGPSVPSSSPPGCR